MPRTFHVTAPIFRILQSIVALVLIFNDSMCLNSSHSCQRIEDLSFWLMRYIAGNIHFIHT